MNAGIFYRRYIKGYASSKLSKSKLKYPPREIREVFGKNSINSRTDPFFSSLERKLIRGVKGLDLGDRARVQLIGTDVERGFIDFTRAG